jgi:hypothetical protein
MHHYKLLNQYLHNYLIKINNYFNKFKILIYSLIKLIHKYKKKILNSKYSKTHNQTLSI